MKTGILKTAILSLVTISVYGLPDLKSLSESNKPITKNTIFGDERLAGEIFEDVDAFSNIELSPMNGDASNYRLPNTTIPTHYNIFFTIDLSQEPLRQSGTVEIHLQATQESVNEIVIHSDALTLSRIELSQGNNQISINHDVDTINQLLRIRLVNGYLAYNVEPNNPVIYILTIDFRSELRDDMRGLYRNWYRNDATESVRWMASTHFQATAARWAFPCYDEPSFKATFSVTIRRQISHRSWFCTRLLETRSSPNTPGFEDDVYHTTPIMSTYLLALIVAEYNSITVTNTDGALSYEVIARPGAINTGQGQYALEAGQALLREMSSHTAYDFYSIHPQLKMTQASVPDFSAGAMENWGLLIYREAYLMLDENETNSVFKQRIASVLSHEIAHMWFGNLVTCDWWDNLWLNEGFARYYQYFLTNWVEGMGFDTRFITEQVHTSLLADSANNPHPLTASALLNTNPAVRTMFSTISYNKGASIIRMTEHLLGFNVHLQGLRNYLRGRAFKTALPIHLFEYLEQAGVQAGVLNYGADFSLIDYYKSWTEQPGHPILDIFVNHQNGEMTIQQRRFNINTGYSTVNNNYIVPITFTTASNPNFVDTKPTHIISHAVTIINRGSVGDEWVIFNKQQTGFYRVNYDEYTWDLISIALRGADRTLIHTYNRAQIVDDVFQFARSGIMTYTRALNILSFLENETDYAPWVAAMTGFNWLRNRLASATTVTQLNQLNVLIAGWASRVMASITYYPTTGETFMQSYLRLQLAPVMCSLGVQDCIDAALSQFQALVLNNIPVPVDSRNWVYCNALRHGTATEFNFLWNRFVTHNVYTEKILILENLGCTKDASSLQFLLNAIVSQNFLIRPQDYTNALSSAVSGNEENTDIALQFMQLNLNLVASAFSDSAATPFSYVIARLRSNERINEFTTWATGNQQVLGSSFNAVMDYANSARASIAWAESVRDDIRYYFEIGAEAPTTSTSAPVTSTTTDIITEYDTDTEAPITTESTSSTSTTPTTTTTTTTEAPITTEFTTDQSPTTPSSATTSFIARCMFFITIILLPLF